MRTEQEIRERLAVYEDMLLSDFPPLSAAVLQGRITLLKWVLKGKEIKR